VCLGVFVFSCVCAFPYVCMCRQGGGGTKKAFPSKHRFFHMFFMISHEIE